MPVVSVAPTNAGSVAPVRETVGCVHFASSSSGRPASRSSRLPLGPLTLRRISRCRLAALGSKDSGRRVGSSPFACGLILLLRHRIGSLVRSFAAYYAETASPCSSRRWVATLHALDCATLASVLGRRRLHARRFLSLAIRYDSYSIGRSTSSFVSPETSSLSLHRNPAQLSSLDRLATRSCSGCNSARSDCSHSLAPQLVVSLLAPSGR